MLNKVTATGIRLFEPFRLTFFRNAQCKNSNKMSEFTLLLFLHSTSSEVSFGFHGGSCCSPESCHCYHSEWIFSVQDTRGDCADAGMGEMFVSSCESACEDASDASKTAGALAYSAMFDFPVWVSRWGDSPHLEFY